MGRKTCSNMLYKRIKRWLLALWNKLKKIASSRGLRNLLLIYIFAEIIFYVRCKYLIYYVNNFVPVTIVQPPFNQKRTEVISKYAKMYNEYNKGSRVKGLIQTFGGECKLHDIKRENVIQFIAWAYFE